MTEEPKLLVFNASAGSGKTFNLAVRYISQLILDPMAYKRILAVTFTNKATTEMKERILGQLYGIAHGEKSSEGYLDNIMKLVPKSREEIREAAAQALQNIIHDYSRFRIETIDSFFQSVMRNLARELEIGANMTIELNNREVLNDAVDGMIEKLEYNSPVLQWLMDYIQDRINENKKWNVAGEIKKFGNNIFNEFYQEKGKDLSEKLKDPAFIHKYKSEVLELRQQIMDVLAGYHDHFFEVLKQHGIEGSELIRGKSGIQQYFLKLKQGIVDDDKLLTGTAVKCMESAENWTSKTSPKRKEIIAVAESDLVEILRSAEETRKIAARRLNSCSLALRHLYNLPLLIHIDEEVKLQNEERNRFMLAATNALLHSLISEGDASFIYEKLGANIDIVMIDEFQDTSRMQWDNFLLLLRECLAKKNGSLIVGDVKQSIYRWRNGDWTILANIKEEESLRPQCLPLNDNWRSEKHIIEFNNGFFKKLCENLDNAVISSLYQDVQQTNKNTEDRGYVKVSLIQKESSEDYQKIMLEQLKEQVDELTQMGVRQDEIAILTRKNKNIAVIADYFDKETDYQVVSDEAFRFDASTAISMMINCIRYLADPENRIPLAQLALDYQKEVLKKETDTNEILLNGIENYLPEAFMANQEKWRFMPLYELLEQLFSTFQMNLIDHQDAYVCAFFDAVMEYLQKHSSEMTAFLTYWDEVLFEKTIPSGEQQGIRIMSIHKSKGLEFHSVLIPFCDWKTENETNDHLIWCAAQGDENDPAVFSELPITPVNYSGSMENSVFSESYKKEQLQLWVDNINLLYVAFTRACCNLFVWGMKNQAGTVSGWIQETLFGKINDDQKAKKDNKSSEKENSDEEASPIISYEYGQLQAPVRKAEKKKESGNRMAPVTEEMTVKMQATDSHSKIEFRQSNRSAAFIDDEGEAEQAFYMSQGSLLHYLFSLIHSSQDLPQALEQLRFEGVTESEEMESRLMETAERLLQIPQMRDWFDGSWRVFNECTIICPTEEGGAHLERPDRVMEKNGELVVLDFKFARKSEKHVQQVQSYMELIREMGHDRVKGYILYGYSGELMEVAPAQQ